MATVLIDGFAIDVTRQEDHGFSSEVTEHPVEKGSDVTDNIRRKPITVSLECIVSDSPISDIRDVRDRSTSLPSNDAFAKMLAIREAGEPVTIETSLDRFENMALETLSVPRSAQNGNALIFNVTFVQIQFVINTRAQVRVTLPRAQKKQNLGGQQFSEAAITGQTSTVSELKDLSAFQK